MTPSRDPNWRAENEALDWLAVLVGIEDRCETARALAWHQKNYPRIFAEMTAAGKEIAALKAELAACWEQLYDKATKGEAE